MNVSETSEAFHSALATVTIHHLDEGEQAQALADGLYSYAMDIGIDLDEMVKLLFPSEGDSEETPTIED